MQQHHLPQQQHHLPQQQHTFEVSNTSFTIDTRYTLDKVVGTGAYGVVISCFDMQNPNRKVAIKKVPKAFDDVTDSKRILREVMLLRHLQHENVVSLLDLIRPNTSLDEFSDVYIVMDLMETDLHRIIYSRQPLTDEHVQFFLFQLLRGLKYIHSGGIIHRDIKPSNLLINGSCDLKICDFGLARGVDHVEANLTEYVVTRWYRAPEIMLSCPRYDYKIDVWSAGCIFAELLQRKPLFPGEDYIHQLHMMTEFLGNPSEEDLAFISSESAKRFMRSLPRFCGVNLAQNFPGASPLALDLLHKMLQFNPENRISVDDALQHEYLQLYAQDMMNPVCDEVFTFQYENIPLNSQMLRELMWEEMCNFHPEARAEFEDRRRRGELDIDRAMLAYQDRLRQQGVAA